MTEGWVGAAGGLTSASSPPSSAANLNAHPHCPSTLPIHTPNPFPSSPQIIAAATSVPAWPDSAATSVPSPAADVRVVTRALALSQALSMAAADPAAATVAAFAPHARLWTCDVRAEVAAFAAIKPSIEVEMGDLVWVATGGRPSRFLHSNARPSP